jgi:hypothetical protein
MILVNGVTTNNNNGYYVTCAGGGMKSAYLNALNFDMGYQRYDMPYYGTYGAIGAIGTASRMLEHPYNNPSMQLNSNTLGQPTNPIYYNGNEIHRKNIIQPEASSRSGYDQSNNRYEKRSWTFAPYNAHYE